MPTYHLSLGSNQGDRLSHLRQAVRQLRPHCTAMAAAPVYETAPVDCPEGSPSFYNTVLRVQTTLAPQQLHEVTLSLEKRAGRAEARERNAPRPLDIDIVLTDAHYESTAALVIPHPRLHERRFVLQPLSDLNPELADEKIAALRDDPASVNRVVSDWLPFAPYPVKSWSELRTRREKGPPITVLTAYDYPTARLLDEAGVDLLLVGDSLGMVVLGLPDTTHVTMEHMLHHVEAVVRASKRALVIGDLPYHSYQTPELAVQNARRLMNAGAHSVKLEGGVSQLPQIQAIIAEGIPLVGHIGMLPQSIIEEGGRYKKKGKTQAGVDALMADARALKSAGAVAYVIESVVAEVAARITQEVDLPSIGIGSGTGTDGQVLVTHDLTGAFPWFRPPFAKPHADVASSILHAARAYIAETHGG